MHRFSMCESGPDFGPLMSRWSAERYVRVTDHVEKTIVFIGRSAPGGQFLPYGTGFLAGTTHDDTFYQNIVTARHVIDDIGIDEILVRANIHDGEAKTIKTDRKWWFSPIKDVDIAFCPSRLGTDIFDILHIPLNAENAVLTDEILEQQNVGLGEDVFICGMYLSRIGETKNLPVVRSGTLAAMPSEMVRTDYGYHHVYLVEARSTGGLSGSPVFLQMAPFRFINENMKPSMGTYPQFFMGMVLGINKLSYPPELIQFLPPDERAAAEKEEEEKERSMPLNTGIAIVLPASYIVQALTDSWIVEMRKEATERAHKRSGYVSQSVMHVAAVDETKAAEDANPDHREDFMRLVGAASKRKPTGDQT